MPGNGVLLTPGDAAEVTVMTVGTEFLACLRALLVLPVPLRGYHVRRSLLVAGSGYNQTNIPRCSDQVCNFRVLALAAPLDAGQACWPRTVALRLIRQRVLTTGCVVSGGGLPWSCDRRTHCTRGWACCASASSWVARRRRRRRCRGHRAGDWPQA